MFDDPRELDRRPALEPDWQKDLQDRAWANRFFTQCVQPIRTQHARSSQPAVCHIHPPPITNQSDHLRALEALVSAIQSACPDLSPRPTVFPAHTQTQLAPGQLINSAQLQTDLSGLWPRNITPSRPSLNVAWLRQTLSNGLPASLTTRISLDTIEDDDDWPETPERLTAGQIISHLGFIPIPTVESEVEPQVNPVAPPAAGSDLISTGKDVDLRLAIEDMTVEMQRKRAHWHARQRVFNFDYLSRRRRWGPYLPVHSQKTRFDLPVGPTEYAEDSDSDDPDWVPGTNRPRAARVPPGNRLRPDWSWLAAARVVAESTLRMERREDGLAIIGAWDNVRGGTWLPSSADCKPAEGSDNDAYASGVRGTEGSDDKPIERDWAGVEGVWRRLVCWLGYDDLVYHHQNGKYDDPELEEVYIISPLSLRITGYSPSPISAYPDRPTLHVEGETGGEGWDGNVYLGVHTVRRVHGTVSALADGGVRWSFYSMNEDNTADQWASELVQLGGVGSAMGALGMWTGADHEDDDPLGVIWQWRVG
ncbi:hypothetical protein VTO73DRAFT_12015 [Trametes versicolor]